MKTLIALFTFFSSTGFAYTSHDQIVRELQLGKVGKAPQHGARHLKPKYNKAEQILPQGKKKDKKDAHKKKRSHKSSKRNGGSK